MQKHVNLVDLVKSFPTNIFLQNLASIQKRTSPIKFAHLAEKSEKGSTSKLSTKVGAAPAAGQLAALLGAGEGRLAARGARPVAPELPAAAELRGGRARRGLAAQRREREGTQSKQATSSLTTAAAL